MFLVMENLMQIEIPEILSECPKKLIVGFVLPYYGYGDNSIWCWYLVGGRVSGKTQTAVRLMLCEALAGKKCAAGRITENKKDSIAETIAEIQTIEGHNCGVKDVKRDYILMANGNKIKLRGFNPSNPESARGFAGYDLVLIDESQYGNAKYFGELRDTMRRNPKSRLVMCANLSEPTDAPGEFVENTVGAVRIECNYVDNHKCPPEVIAQAERDKETNYEYYLNNWMGKPLTAGDMAIFRYENLQGLRGTCMLEQWVATCAALDFAPGSTEVGVKTDPNVLTIVGINLLGQRKVLETLAFTDTNPLAIVGRITGELRKRGIKHVIVDSTGAGELVAPLLIEQGFVAVQFFGEKKNFVPHNKQKSYLNNRAYAYFLAAETALNHKLLCSEEKTISELSAQTYKYSVGGMRKIEPKSEIKKRIKHSPDYADSLVMANLLCEKYFVDLDPRNNYYYTQRQKELDNIGDNRGFTDGFCKY